MKKKKIVLLPQKLGCCVHAKSVARPCKVCPEYTLIQGEFAWTQGEFEWLQGGICMDAGGNLNGCNWGICMKGTYMTFRGY